MTRRSRPASRSAPAIRPTPAAPDHDWRRGPLLPVIVGCLCFLPALLNDFTYDDVPIVRDNTRIRQLSDLPSLWATDYWKAQPGQERVLEKRRDRLYRPLTMSTYALNYAVHGPRPIGFLAANVLLHGLACGLVWQLARRLLDSQPAATCAGLLFAVHPVHAEAVANVVGRAELLSAIFMMLGLLVLLSRASLPGVGRVAAAGGLIFLALTAKETAICAPAVALIVLYADQRFAGKRTWRWWLQTGAILALPVVLYLPLRYMALEGHLTRVAPPGRLMNPLTGYSLLEPRVEHMMGVLTVVGHYARLLLVPARLCADYSYAVIDPSRSPAPLTIVGAVAVLGTLVALGGYLRRGRQWRTVAGLAAIFVASYALISNTVLIIGVAVAERLMYWPSVPVVMLISMGCLALWRAVCEADKASQSALSLIRLAGIGLLVALGLGSGLRSTDWASNDVLFRADIETHPRSAHLRMALSDELIMRGRAMPLGAERDALFDEAREHARRAVEIAPWSVAAMQTYGAASFFCGDNAEAVRFLERAGQLAPLDEFSRRALASARGQSVDTAQRIDELRRRIATAPSAELYVELGECLVRSGRNLEGLEAAEQAARLAPGELSVRWLLARALIANDEPNRASRALRAVLELDRNHWQAHTNLAVLLVSANPTAALSHARAAVELAPDTLETNQNLAGVLALCGHADEAIRLYRHVQQKLLAPDDPLQQAIERKIEELGRE